MQVILPVGFQVTKFYHAHTSYKLLHHYFTLFACKYQCSLFYRWVSSGEKQLFSLGFIMTVLPLPVIFSALVQFEEIVGHVALCTDCGFFPSFHTVNTAGERQKL